jgi:HAD superfamily hydrolase (TIGR01509 family)
VGIRALILDFDGLILDTESPARAAWLDVFEEHGLTVPAARWASLLGADADFPQAYDMLEDHLGKPVDRGTLHTRLMARQRDLLEFQDVLPGVRALLDAAQAAGITCAVASSSDRAWVEGLLGRHDLMSTFGAVICAEDVARTKPFPDLFIKALDRLNVKANEAIAFEDSQHGVKAAKRAGLFCVAVPNEVTRCLSFEEADLVVPWIGEYSLEQYADLALAARRHRTTRQHAKPEDRP